MSKDMSVKAELKLDTSSFKNDAFQATSSIQGFDHSLTGMKQSMDRAEQGMQPMDKVIKELGGALNDAAAVFQRYSNGVSTIEDPLEKAANKAAAARRQLKKMQDALNDVSSMMSAPVNAIKQAFSTLSNTVKKISNIVSAPFKAISKGLSSATGLISSQINKIKGMFSSLSSATNNVRDKISGSLTKIGAAAMVAGAGLSMYGKSVMDSYSDFSSTMQKAAVVAGGTTEDIKGLNQVAYKMGETLPISANESSQAMLGMAQNGASVKDLKEEFPAIAKAATAAGESLDGTANTVQEAMNIWGDSLESPTQAAGILVQTANASNASISSMQEAFANVGATAHSLGINMSDTAESIGLLTNKGMTSQRASMDLNNALINMAHPSAQAKKALDKLGVSFFDSQGKMKPLQENLEALSKATANYTPQQKTATLATAFGTAGMAAMSPLMESVANKTGNASVSWSAYAEEQKKAAGSTDNASKTLDSQISDMSKSVGYNLKTLKDDWNNLNNGIQDNNSTMTNSVIGTLKNMIDWLKKSNSPIANLTRTIMALAPILGPALTGLGGLVLVLGQLSKLNPLVLLLGAITTAVTVLGFSSGKAGKQLQEFGKKFDFSNIQKNISSSLDNIKNKFSQFMDGLQKTLNVKGLIDTIQNTLSSFGQVFQNIFNTIKEAITGTSSTGKDASNNAGASFGNIINHIMNVINHFDQMIVAFSKSPQAKAFIDIIVQSIKNVITFIKQAIQNVKDFVQGFINTGVVKKTWDTIVDVVNSVKDAIKAVIDNISPMNKTLDGVGNHTGGFQAIGQKAGDITKSILDGFKKLVQNISKVIQGIASSGVFSTLVNSAKKVGQAIGNIFKGSGNNKKGQDPMKQLGKSIGNILKDVIKLTTNITLFFLKIAGNKTAVKTIAIIATSFLGVYKSLQLVVKGAQAVIGIKKGIETMQAAMKILNATGLVTKLMWGGIIVVIGLIIEGIVLFFTKTKTGRKMLQGMVQAWRNFQKWIGEVFMPAMSNAVQNIGKFFGSIGSFFGKVQGKINAFFKSIGDVFGKIWNTIKDAFTRYKNTITAEWKMIGNIFKDSIALITNPINQAKKDFKKIFKDIWKIIKNPFKPKNWKNLGRDLLNGLINGIKSVWGGIKKVGGDVANGIKDTFKAALGIHSPSRVMADEVGQYIPAGIAKGITDNQQGMIENIKDSMSKMKSQISNTNLSMPMKLKINDNNSLKDYSSLLQSRINNLSNQSKSMQNDMSRFMNNDMQASIGANISISKQPANINFKLGNSEYSAFVSDISNQQNKVASLSKIRGF